MESSGLPSAHNAFREIESLKAEVKELKTELRQANADLESEQEITRTFGEKLTENKQNIEQLTFDNAQLRKKYRQTKKDLAYYRDAKEERADMINTLRNQNEEHVKEFSLKTSDLEQEVQQRSKNLKKQHAREIMKKEALIDQLKKKMIEMQNSNLRLERSMGAYQRREGEQALKNEITALERQNLQMEEDINNLSRDFEILKQKTRLAEEKASVASKMQRAAEKELTVLEKKYVEEKKKVRTTVEKEVVVDTEHSEVESREILILNGELERAMAKEQELVKELELERVQVHSLTRQLEAHKQRSQQQTEAFARREDYLERREEMLNGRERDIDAVSGQKSGNEASQGRGADLRSVLRATNLLKKEMNDVAVREKQSNDRCIELIMEHSAAEKKIHEQYQAQLEDKELEKVEVVLQLEAAMQKVEDLQKKLILTKLRGGGSVDDEDVGGSGIMAVLRRSASKNTLAPVKRPGSAEKKKRDKKKDGKVRFNPVPQVREIPRIEVEDIEGKISDDPLVIMEVSPRSPGRGGGANANSSPLVSPNRSPRGLDSRVAGVFNGARMPPMKPKKNSLFPPAVAFDVSLGDRSPKSGRHRLPALADPYS